jgi:Ca-activated chloride channel family protein
MTTSFLGIMWAGIDNGIYLPLLLIIIISIVYRVMRSFRAARALSNIKGSTRALLTQFSAWRVISKAVLMGIAACALFLALLRPQWGLQQESITQEGRDLFVALDISRSMLAQDCMPNRLAVAKKKIHALVQQLACERVGLILFSGSAFVQCPLTADYGAFFMFLDHIDVETISSGTTALDGAIKKAIEAFGACPDRKNKIVLVITDGEDFSTNLSRVKDDVVASGMHIFTLGIGTIEGAPIPLFDARGTAIGHQKDKKGGIVISRLNEDLLQALSHDSGGMYVRATPDDTDVRSVAKLVARYEKERFADKKINRYEDRYPYFLAVSFAALALEWLL